MDRFTQYLEKHRERIDRELEKRLEPTGGPADLVEQAMLYAVMGGGKRLRPILALEACLVCGGELPAALGPAAALEMIHTYSLIHDDLPAMDDDDLRRGRATTHKAFGEAEAILAGDGLLTLAFKVLATSPAGPGYAPARCQAVELVAECAGIAGMVGGQVADLAAEKTPVDATGLEWIHRHKTGALLRASVELGAIIAGAPDRERQALRRYGEAIGLAFQISDDLLDRTATADQLGKTPGKDLEAGKTTYPSLLGMDGARQEAERQVGLAISALDCFERPTSILDSLATYSISRTH